MSRKNIKRLRRSVRGRKMDVKELEKVKLVIPGRLPSMNQIIAASKSHYGQYSSMKGIYTNLVAREARAQKLPIFERVSLTITWYCKNKRQDPDNIASGEKFLLDGLVKAGKLPNDGWKQVQGLSHHFEVDKQNERVEVILEEISTGEEKS